MPRSWTLDPKAERAAAIKWFRRRTPLGSAEADSLAENSRRQGFWMARVHTASRAKRIKDSLRAALQKGKTFEQWKRENKGILQRVPRHHLATTFRNFTQTSYTAARVNYLSQPEVMKRRPYWVFDAVIDGATTPVCTAYNGTVLPAGHRWFLARMPPLHHNCRSTIRGLTRHQAQKLGILGRAPADTLTKKKIAEAGAEDKLKPGKVAPQPGFGSHILEPWQPTAKQVGRKQVRRLKRPARVDTKQREAEEARRRKVADEARRQAAEDARKKVADAKARAEAEVKRRAEEAQRKAAEEAGRKKAQEEAARKAKEAAEKRRLEAKRKAEAAALRRKAEAEKRAADLKQKQEAERKAAEKKAAAKKRAEAAAKKKAEERAKRKAVEERARQEAKKKAAESKKAPAKRAFKDDPDYKSAFDSLIKSGVHPQEAAPRAYAKMVRFQGRRSTFAELDSRLAGASGSREQMRQLKGKLSRLGVDTSGSFAEIRASIAETRPPGLSDWDIQEWQERSANSLAVAEMYAGHTARVKGGKIRFGKIGTRSRVSPGTEEAVNRAGDFYSTMADESLMRRVTKEYSFENTNRRGYCNGARAKPYINMGVIQNPDDAANLAVHELGHAIDFESQQWTPHQAFIERRRKGGERKLSEITGSSAYDDDEVAFDGGFFSPYVGKAYNGSANEVFAMGVEAMHGSPTQFYQQDPEHFELTIGLLSAEGREGVETIYVDPAVAARHGKSSASPSPASWDAKSKALGIAK